MSRLSVASFRALSPESGASVAVNRRAARAAAYLSVLDTVSDPGRTERVLDTGRTG